MADPFTIYTVVAAGLNIGSTFFGGKAYRASLRSQRLMNELKGARDYNNTWRDWIETEKLNYAVYSSSGAMPEYSGTFRAIQQEVGRKKESDLDDIKLMTMSMTDEFNSRIASSRQSDMWNILSTAAQTKISLHQIALNKQHKEIVKAGIERETKFKTGFTMNRKGHFTSRRDLFNYNPDIRPKSLSVYKNAYDRYWLKTREFGGDY